MVCMILVQPQMGENIGAAARSMLNFGLAELRLVAPRDGWPNEKADTMSAGALAAMPPVRVFDTLQDAIADLHFVLGTTARPRDMVKPVFAPAEAVKEAAAREQSGQKAGFLFGAERMGLLNDDIALCQGVVNIPVNPDFTSLNIATAVLVMAYEWSRLHLSPLPSGLHRKDSLPAMQEGIEGFLSRLILELEEKHFFRSGEVAPYMKRNLRNLFVRADITEQELRTLHGVLSALLGKNSEP